LTICDIRTSGVRLKSTTRNLTNPRTIAGDVASDLARISFWDALIVASAEEVEADELLSEDLSAGQSIVGIRVVNPLDGGYMGYEVHDSR
jgi:predicted nucleic acid-binding protein